MRKWCIMDLRLRTSHARIAARWHVRKKIFPTFPLLKSRSPRAPLERGIRKRGSICSQMPLVACTRAVASATPLLVRRRAAEGARPAPAPRPALASAFSGARVPAARRAISASASVRRLGLVAMAAAVAPAVGEALPPPAPHDLLIVGPGEHLPPPLPHPPYFTPPLMP